MQSSCLEVVLCSTLYFRQEFLNSGRPLLLKCGLNADYVDDLIGKAKKELKDAKTPAYIMLDTLYARKRHT